MQRFCVDEHDRAVQVESPSPSCLSVRGLAFLKSEHDSAANQQVVSHLDTNGV